MKNKTIALLVLLLGLILIIFLGIKLISNDAPTTEPLVEQETNTSYSITIKEDSSKDLTQIDSNVSESLEEKADLPQIPDGKIAIEVKEPLMLQETNVTDGTSYHELLTDLSANENQLLFADFVTDSSLQEVLDHLYSFEYNFTLNQIGLSSQANSHFVLCNKLNQVPSNYVPEDLVIPDLPATTDQDVDKRYVREEMAHALEAFFSGAKDNGYQLYCLSGYRSYATQAIVYNNFVENKGLENADKISARPSHSEHQTGLAMDVTTEAMGFRLMTALGETEEGIYIRDHAHEFGLIVRYPIDGSSITGYSYEPWHLRYVGIELATFLYEHDLTLEEFYYTVQSQMYLIERTD